MKIKLNNRGYGLIVKSSKLGISTYSMSFSYNSRSEQWHLTVAGYVTGIAINRGRALFRNEYGYLIAESTVGKTDFNELTWVDTE